MSIRLLEVLDNIEWRKPGKDQQLAATNLQQICVLVHSDLRCSLGASVANANVNNALVQVATASTANPK